MTNIITANDGTSAATEPYMLVSFEIGQESQNIVDDIIGGGIAVVLIRPHPRKGVLRLFYETEAEAESCRNLHQRETTFSLISTDVTSLSMTYVLDGRLSPALADDTDDRWVVEVGFQEIET